MRAALVDRFDAPPRYGDLADPPRGDGDVRIRVRAAAASQLTRAVAAGKHYSSVAEFPFVPGFDGVGVDEATGRRVYFAGVARPYGAMAELAVVPAARAVAVPDGVDDVTAAALANPGMSSWAALTRRAAFVRGERVLVNGATGASGTLAVQIARHLGAAEIIATGRNAAALAALPALGADRVISLDQPAEALRDAFAACAFDVVLDYLWGPPAEAILAALARQGHGHGTGVQRRVRFVQIGAMAGATIPMAAGTLRSTRLELLGSGLGASSIEELVAAIGELFAAVGPAGLGVATEAAPLAEVQAAWTRDTGARRLVFVT